jgi:hypothetical protein
MIHILFLKAANGGRGIVGSGYNQGFKNLDERDLTMAPSTGCTRRASSRSPRST